MKHLKSFIAMLLALTMIFCVAGCGKDVSDDEKIIGKWVASLDFTAYMNSIFDELDLADSVIPKDVPMNSYMIFEFTEDSCSMYFDRDKTIESVGAYLDEFERLLAEDVYNQIEASGLTREDADEQFMQAYGITIPEYAELMVTSTMSPEAVTDSFIESGSAKGIYKLEDGKLYIAEGELALDNADYYNYSFDGDTLLIEGASSETFFSSFAEAGIEFPIAFEKE